MSSLQVTPIQFLRSEVENKRPDPNKLLPGQGAVNTYQNQPGFFFANSTGTSLFKVGPCSVGSIAPNFGVTGPTGGNTLGELWLDTTNSTYPTLNVWGGASWKSTAGNVTRVSAPTNYTDPGALGQVAMNEVFFFWHDGTRWRRAASSAW